jgi:hypothetical protein
VQTAADVHEKTAERMTRHIRTLMRATKHDIPWNLPDAFIPHLFEECVRSVNDVPNVKTDWKTPTELVSGKRPDGHYHRFPFGTVAFCYEKNDQDKMAPRARLGIVLGREQDTRALKVFLLDNREIVSRDKLVPAKLTPDLINRINSLNASSQSAEENVFLWGETEPVDSVDAADGEQRPDENSASSTDVRVMDAIPDVVPSERQDREESGLDVVTASQDLPAQGEASPGTNDGNLGEQLPKSQGTIGDVDSERGINLSPGATRRTDRPDPAGFPERAVRSGDAHVEGLVPKQAEMLPADVVREAVPAAVRTDLDYSARRMGSSSSSSSSRNAQSLTGPAVTQTSRRPSTKEVDGSSSSSARRADSSSSSSTHQSVQGVRKGGGSGSIRHQSGDPAVGGVGIGVGGVTVRKTKTGRPSQADYNLLHTKGTTNLTTAGLVLGHAMDYQFVGMVSGQDIPYRQAAADAVTNELKQILDYGVWSPVSQVPKGIKVIPSKMFLVIKYGSDGKYSKHKARLVAGGHKEYIDPAVDTSSPTVRFETLLIVLSIAAHKKYKVRVADVGGAYLEAHLSRDDVYIRLERHVSELLVKIDPTYSKFIDCNGQIVVKLKKALYGLKEASMEWYQHLVAILKEDGFTVSSCDSAMLYKFLDNGDICIIVLHVDDILIVGPESSIVDFIKLMKFQFKKITVDEDGEVHQYLGLLLKSNKDGSITLNQPGYVQEIIQSFNLSPEMTSELPYTQNLFTIDSKSPVSRPKDFRSLVMKLQYLTKTRPDLKLPVAFLSTRSANPTLEDHVKLRKVACYVNGTQELGMVLNGDSMNMVCSADASFAVHGDAKSHTGVCLRFGERSAPIHVESKKQNLVTASSTEAEMVALSTGTKEVVWTRAVLAELGFKQSRTVIEQDNKSCITLSYRGPGRSVNSRAINIKYFWVHQFIESGDIALEYVPSDKLLADGLTKPHPRGVFLKWRDDFLNTMKVEDVGR